MKYNHLWPVVINSPKELGYEKMPLKTMSTALLFPHLSEKCSV